ncbi:MAG: acyltransferase family protein, partial [Bacteroidia bacterium]
MIITHVELIKQMMGCKGLWDKSKLVFELGGLGVVFFFVLSGFLITYLLLKEKSQTGTISVRKFYLRRLLRIWPLYYFIVFLGFLVLPHVGLMEIPFAKMNLEKNYGLNFALYMLMLPNLAFAMFGAVPHIGQAWSIGVEEQFYIIWPLIVKFSNHILRALFIVIGLLIT